MPSQILAVKVIPILRFRGLKCTSRNAAFSSRLSSIALKSPPPSTWTPASRWPGAGKLANWSVLRKGCKRFVDLQDKWNPGTMKVQHRGK